MPQAASYVFAPPSVVSVHVLGSGARFPVHRVYCVGRNYAEHAKEMGFSGREAPFFFLKPADAVLAAEPDQTLSMPYPSLTQDLQHEVEWVVAIGKGGRHIAAADAMQHVFGHAVGLDMTRRDLQAEMKKQGRPWCIGKAFEASAPIGPITPWQDTPGLEEAEIELRVNGERRQHSPLSQLIWRVPEVIEHLSAAWTLQPGDLIYTGTPAGVGAVQPGDHLQAQIGGLAPLALRIA